jgi:putative phosphoesterase
MVVAGDFKNGITFEMDGNVFQVIEFQHVKPGKGAAFVRTKLKNVISGAVVEKTFSPTDKYENAYIERKDMQYSYTDGDLYYFMDMETFDMLTLNADKLISVRGNCEAEVDQMVLNFPVMSTTACVLDTSANLSIYMSHGHIYSPDALPPMPKGSIFLSGHTHVLMAENKDGILCVNPGSVSLPKNGNPKSYAVYENRTVTVKTLSGEKILCATV